MDEGGGPGANGPLPVSWDEARELVALVLLLSAASIVVSPVVRELADELETFVAHDLWPLPSYRELLFVK